MTYFFVVSRFVRWRDTVAVELAINYCRNKHKLQKKQEKERKRKGKKRKLIAPRSASFGNRERTKRQRRHRENEIGPSEKLHSRALRNAVIPHYHHIVVWIAAFVDCETFCLPRNDDIAHFLSPWRRAARDTTCRSWKPRQRKTFPLILVTVFSKRCNSVNRTVRLKQVTRALCSKHTYNSVSVR